MTTATKPKWAEISATGGLRALTLFNGIWYEKKPLSREAEIELLPLYEKYPMDEPNFKAWVKQRMRQVYENSLK